MTIRLASDLSTDSIVDGPGIRTVIWTQGCAHNCPGCHNPGTHSMSRGVVVDVEEIKDVLDEIEGQDGITFSGGDPLYQIDPVIELAKYIKSTKKMNIWVYSGFTYEEIISMPRGKELLETVDCLVDGKFMMERRSLDLLFRGSDNQRVIDTRQSLKKGKVVLIEKYMKKKDITPLYKKDEDIFV